MKTLALCALLALTSCAQMIHELKWENSREYRVDHYLSTHTVDAETAGWMRQGLIWQGMPEHLLKVVRGDPIRIRSTAGMKVYDYGHEVIYLKGYGGGVFKVRDWYQ